MNQGEHEIEPSGQEFSKIAPIGTILTSILPPKKFLKVAGDAWVPADGREIEGTPYSKLTKHNVVPDLRGMFLRGLNDFRGPGPHDRFTGVEVRNDGQEDPEDSYEDDSREMKKRAAGDYQKDILKWHHHRPDDRGYFLTRGGTYPQWDFQSTSQKLIGREYRTDVGTRTGAETRPKNVAVYYYIKIK